MINLWFNFDRFLDLLETDPQKAFDYRDNCYKKEKWIWKEEKTKKFVKKELEKILIQAWIKYSKNSKTETLLKKAIDNNLI